MAKKIYLSPAAHGHDNPCSFSKTCGENIHCNLYADELQKILAACGFEVRRAPKTNTGEKVADTIADSNAWNPDLHYVVHTNGGKGHYSKLMVYDNGNGHQYAEVIADARKAVFSPVNITIEPQWDELRRTKAVAVYDELLFHDNPTDIAWLHGHFYEMAAATAKGICRIFGYKFVDPNDVVKTVTPAPSAPSAPSKPSVSSSPSTGVNPVLKPGDRVRVKSGVTAFADGTGMASFVRDAVLYVRQVGSGKVLVSTVKTGAVTGWVKTSDVKPA